MTMPSEDDIALAGEYVLGLLDPAETAAAQARVATNADFAAEVDAWRERLQSMVVGADTVAPDHVWHGIAASLPAPTGQDTSSGNVRLWQGLTAASLALAAWLGFQSLQTPVIVPMENKPPMIAALGSETGNAAITARYDEGTGELLLTPVSLDTGKLYPELWIIPADGTPRSLGMMNRSGATQLIVRADLRTFMAKDAVLAITPEPQSGGPGGKPTGAVLASGKMTTI
jgi:anti-sigma-K factor RskA